MRKVDAQRSCDYFGIPFLEGEYNIEGWLETVKGYEYEPEKGSRCIICFDDRLEATCQKAVELDEKKFTTTLLMSPQKDHEQLKAVGRFLKNRYDVEFVFDDFRSGGGTQAQTKMARDRGAYHQDYCGCIFALEEQRKKQGKIMHEMFSPLHGQLLSGSIEERLALYEKRFELEKEGKGYTLYQEQFLNYRLLQGLVKWDKIVQKSYILSYSTLSHPRIKGEVMCGENGEGILTKGDVTILSLEMFEKITQQKWDKIDNLIKSPLGMDEEMGLRQKMGKSPFDLSTIIVVENIPFEKKIEIHMETLIFQETREKLST